MSESAPRISPEVREKAIARIGAFRWGREWQLLDTAPEVITRDREREAGELLTTILPLLCGEPCEGKTWTIYACPDPECEEFDTQTWTNRRASEGCAHANHPEAVRTDVMPVISRPLSGELVEERDFWEGRHQKAVDAQHVTATELDEAEQELEQVRGERERAYESVVELEADVRREQDKLSRAREEVEARRDVLLRRAANFKGKRDTAHANLAEDEGLATQIREGVAEATYDAVVLFAEEDAHRLQAILDSSSSVSGDWHYGVMRMGHRWYATRFHPSQGDNDGDLPDAGDTEFWEDGQWHSYTIAAFQERHHASNSGDVEERGEEEASRYRWKGTHFLVAIPPDTPEGREEVAKIIGDLAQPKDTHLSGGGERLEEAVTYLRGLADDSRMEAEGGGGELPLGDQLALHGKAEGYADAAEYLESNFGGLPQLPVGVDGLLNWLEGAPRERGTNTLHRPDCEARRRGKSDEDCTCGLTMLVRSFRDLATRLSPEQDCDDLCTCGHLRHEHRTDLADDFTTLACAQACPCQKFTKSAEQVLADLGLRPDVEVRESPENSSGVEEGREIERWRYWPEGMLKDGGSVSSALRGDWVKYSDHKAALAAVVAALTQPVSPQPEDTRRGFREGLLEALRNLEAASVHLDPPTWVKTPVAAFVQFRLAVDALLTTHLSEGDVLPDPGLTRDEAKLLLGARDPEPVEHPNCAARERARGKLRAILATTRVSEGERLKVTRVELSGVTMVECELVALKQMHKALKGLAEGDYSAEEMQNVIAQLVAAPLLQNAASTEEVPWSERQRLSEGTGDREQARLWDALRLLAITHFDHERLITDENFDCTELFEAGLVKHIEIGGCGEKSCTLTAEGMGAIQEALDLDLSPESRLSMEGGEEGLRERLLSREIVELAWKLRPPHRKAFKGLSWGDQYREAVESGFAALDAAATQKPQDEDRWVDEGLKHPPLENQQTVRLKPQDEGGDASAVGPTDVGRTSTRVAGAGDADRVSGPTKPQDEEER